MKKTTLYRQAGWIAESILDHVGYHVDRLQAIDEKDDEEKAELACYKAIQEYLENMDFLKAVKF